MFRSRYGDRLIDISLLVISIFGVVMIGSASVGETSGQGGFFAIKNMIKQIIFIIIGMIAMLFVKRFFKTSLVKRRVLNLLYAVMVAAMLFCLAFTNVHGGHSWIPVFGIFSIQPAEFAKLLLMLILAYYMVDVPRAMQISPKLSLEMQQLFARKKRVECLYKPLLLCLILFAICLFLQKDLGTAVIMLGIMLVCFFSATDSYYKKYQHWSFIAIVVCFILLMIAFPLLMKMIGGYRAARIQVWLDPLSDPLGDGYQQLNGLISFAKDGFFGRGLGNSTQKFGYIPEAYNDYITAIIFEELGLFGLALIVIPYGLIIWRMFHYAYRINDHKAKIILCGIGSYFFLHLFLNLGGVSGLIPMTGIPLLCISSGGSSTLSAYLAVGIAQSMIWRYNKEKAAQEASR